MSRKLTNYINGKMVPPSTGEYIENINPSTGEINNLIPSSDERDVNAAVAAAKQVTPPTHTHTLTRNPKNRLTKHGKTPQLMNVHNIAKRLSPVYLRERRN